MGLPQDNEAGYASAANRSLAGNLTGKLLLIHGTSDISASSFPSAMKMIQALMEAGKPFDLIVGPEQAHSWSGLGAGSALATVRRYFREHLKR
jgi:dipeptidyl aminopeptidase/acylaminoacyl peptidase